MSRASRSRRPGKRSAAKKRTDGLRARAEKVDRIRRELSRAGVMERVRGVRRVLGSEAFDDKFNTALAAHPGPPITETAQVRALVFRIVEEMGVDHGDVDLTLTWDPGIKKLDLWVKVKHATAAKAAVSVGLFAVESVVPQEAPCP